MIAQISAFLAEQFQWQLSLLTLAGIAVVSIVGRRLFLLVPTFREAGALNDAAFRKKMERPGYAQNQAWNRKWGMLHYAVTFLLILPFCLTLESQGLWRIARDIATILLVYDFFYYLTHRFLFHDAGLFKGPLMWVHAVHHRQHNPCRQDSSYIHPIEVALGLGLYVATILVLSQLIGRFHVATIVITWIAFSQINLHNHDLWKSDRFPFRYLAYMSRMHHHHHGRFTGGNFATISPLYDWMFGTLDHGQGFGKNKRTTRAGAKEAQVRVRAPH